MGVKIYQSYSKVYMYILLSLRGENKIIFIEHIARVDKKNIPDIQAT